jgi:hypothetical protein
MRKIWEIFLTVAKEAEGGRPLEKNASNKLKSLGFICSMYDCQRIILASANGFVAFSGAPANVPPTGMVAQLVKQLLDSHRSANKFVAGSDSQAPVTLQARQPSPTKNNDASC